MRQTISNLGGQNLINISEIFLDFSRNLQTKHSFSAFRGGLSIPGTIVSAENIHESTKTTSKGSILQQRLLALSIRLLKYVVWVFGRCLCVVSRFYS